MDSNALVSLQATQKGSVRTSVLLQTATGSVDSGKQRRFARLVFDRRSQHTFIVKNRSQEMNCKLLGMAIMAIGVFGGESEDRTFRSSNNLEKATQQHKN